MLFCGVENQKPKKITNQEFLLHAIKGLKEVTGMFKDSIVTTFALLKTILCFVYEQRVQMA